MVNANPSSYITAESRPNTVNNAKWAMRLSIDNYVNYCLAGVAGYTPAQQAGYRLAEDIHHLIIEGHGINQYTTWS